MSTVPVAFTALSHARLPESFLDRLEVDSCPVMLPSRLLHPSMKSSSEKLRLIPGVASHPSLFTTDRTVGSSSQSPAKKWTDGARVCLEGVRGLSGCLLCLSRACSRLARTFGMVVHLIVSALRS
ncbi:hypothetical protein CFP56_041835 [Quercus suber]|uniref:Uncharacterized protein n=1 Tax=Quercus suber TaxID=58331 RepID=A0AAW0IV00_QUESU